MRNNETGRSMVEMLGVLAVIGVLSIGGIAGYMIAMNRHHSNNVLEGVSARAVIISAQKMMGQPAAHPADMAEEIDDYAVAVVEEPRVCAECFGIEVSGIPQGVCRYILNQKWTTPEGVYLNDDEYPTEDGTNCDEADNVIEFVFSPSMGDESHTCGYCQHDENGTCVADETCENGCPGDKPMKGNNDRCYSCSFRLGPTVDATECAKCSNRYLTSAGKCVLCNTSGSAAADASECAKCPNRSMQDGLCVRDRCSDGLWMSSSGNCFDCSDNTASAASETECAKCSNRIMLDNGNCALKECPQLRNSSGSCVACSNDSSMYYTDANACIVCPNRFKDVDGRCYSCDRNASITAEASECAKCSNRVMLNNVTCAPICPDGQWRASDGEGICRSCTVSSIHYAAASECAKCSNRFMSTIGTCIACNNSGAISASTTECAKCSERKMQGGKCVLKECPSGKTKQDDGSCA